MISESATKKAQNSMATAERATQLVEEEQATAQAEHKIQETAEAEARAATRTAAIEQAKASATTQAQPMFETVKQLVADGYISHSLGVYYLLPDFDESWAQLNWYQWWYTGYAPDDFVIRADIAWDSASETADWWNSGCGFVFRIAESGDHYLAYFALDGYVRFQRTVRGNSTRLGSSYYGKVDLPTGQANVMLVVEGSSFTLYVNDEKVHSRQDTALSSGLLAYTLVSGTNKDYGVRCQMTNVELWEIAQ
jgi:hypothetical protein